MTERREIDPSLILRGIDDDQRRVQEAMAPNMVLLYVVWGIAWVVAFTAFFLMFVPEGDPLLPVPVGLVIGIGVGMAAIVFSAIHSARRGSGSRGPSVVQGAIYGNAFGIAFTLMGVLAWRLIAAGVPVQTMLSFWVALPCLIVGILGLVGSAMWNDLPQLVFGGWTLVIGFLSVALPPPYTLLAGIVGGVGYLALAVVQTVRPALMTGPIARSTDG